MSSHGKELNFWKRLSLSMEHVPFLQFWGNMIVLTFGQINSELISSIQLIVLTTETILRRAMEWKTKPTNVHVFFFLLVFCETSSDCNQSEQCIQERKGKPIFDILSRSSKIVKPPSWFNLTSILSTLSRFINQFTWAPFLPAIILLKQPWGLKINFPFEWLSGPSGV